METVSARLEISVYVDCPNDDCDSLINLMCPDDTSGVDHNDCGVIVRQACPDGAWYKQHEKFQLTGVTCTECGTEFNVKGIEW